MVIENINRYFRVVTESCFDQKEASSKIKTFRERVDDVISHFENFFCPETGQVDREMHQNEEGFDFEEYNQERTKNSKFSKNQEIDSQFFVQVMKDANNNLKNLIESSEFNSQKLLTNDLRSSNSIQAQLCSLLKLTESTKKIVKQQKEQLERQNEIIESSIKAQLISQPKPKSLSKSITVDLLLPTNNSLRQDFHSKSKFPSKKTNKKDTIKNLSVNITPVKNESEPGIVGGAMTLLAMKDPKSYLIASFKMGMKLIEKKTTIFMKKLPSSINQVWDAIYTKNQNCYFLIIGSSLYRKDIDAKKPYLFNNKISISYQLGNSLR